MKKQRKQVDEQEIVRFNLMREKCYSKTYNKEDMKSILKQLGYSSCILRFMTKGENPPIVQIKRGMYQFSGKPIFIQRLQTVWDEYIRRNKQPKQSKPTQQMNIADAIALLKKEGYKILKQVIQYEEI